MPRSATRSRSMLAAAGVAVLATVALTVSAMHDSHEAATADAPSSVAVSPVAIATPAPAIRAEAAPAVRAEAKIATGVRRAPEPVGTAGLRVALNTDGNLGMPLGVDETFNQSSEGLTEVTLPDGSVMVDLEGRFQVHSVMVRDASGRIHVRCVHDPAQALDPRHVHHAFETALPSAER